MPSLTSCLIVLEIIVCLNARMARFGVRVNKLYSPENRVFNSHAPRRGRCGRAGEVFFKRGAAASIRKNTARALFPLLTRVHWYHKIEVNVFAQTL
jgi:hypothetical protein